MRYKFFQVSPESVDILNVKDCYSVGEIGCSKELIALSMKGNPESISLGFGDENKLYGVCGSYRQWSGSAQLWAIFTKDSEQYPIALRRACLQLIFYAVEKQALHRVSLTVKSSYTKGNRFAHSLGFDFEGKMLAFLPDASDAHLYARLF